MGEAWFMGENRRMFPELGGDLNQLPVEALQRALGEAATGPTSFGPFEEWTSWYHYLLPRLIPRAQEKWIHSLLEILLTAFFSQHPDGIARQAYEGFRHDAAATLGRCVMAADAWPAGRPDLYLCFDRYYNERTGSWRWYDVSGRLSASMCFHLKYLAPEETEAWLRSVFAVRSTHWRAQVTVWFVGAFDLLTGAIQQPSEIPLDGSPDIGWEWHHCLSGNYTGSHTGSEPVSVFLPAENRRRAIGAARALVASGDFLAWVDSFYRYEYLVSELGDLPGRFFDLYAPPQPDCE